MNEREWWDLWNTSHRTKENNDAVSSELFSRAANAVNAITTASPARVLEIACGTGTLSRMLKYSSYVGLDISPAAIQVAKEKSAAYRPAEGAKHPYYESADFHEWSLPEEPFDVTICIDAISSIRDQAAAMRKMANSLRIGGHLVMTTINRFVYDRIRRSTAVRLESGPVSKWLYRSELNDLVEQAGLEIEISTTIMPRGELGILRIINSCKLNESLGPRFAFALRALKERAGLGQYSLIVARKDHE